MTDDSPREPRPFPGDQTGPTDGDTPGVRGPHRGPRPLAPTILLLLVGGGLLLAIGLWTGGYRRQRTSPVAAAAAPLTVLEPKDSAQVDAPLEVTFSTTAPLHLTPMGWQAGSLHLHALVDGAQVMPGALDIHALGDGRFRWKLKAVGPGPHDIRLVWARPDHHAIPEGASGDVPFTVK